MQENYFMSPTGQEPPHFHVYQQFIGQLSYHGQSLPGEYPFSAVYQVLQGASDHKKDHIFLQYPKLQALHYAFTHLQGDPRQAGIFRAQFVEELRTMSGELLKLPPHERTFGAFRGLPPTVPSYSKQKPTRRYVVKAVFGDTSSQR